MTKKLFLFAIATLALALPQVRPAQDPATQTPDRVVNVIAERFTFTPSRIMVKKGELVELVIISDDTDHGFHLSAAGIDAAIPQQGKGELRLRFLAGVSGRFGFECSRACGAGHNLMRGYVEVE
jgi:heme/copper-type cytochrome/quinol oxidase subunit 2